MSAAERRVRALAPGAPTLAKAVEQVIADLIRGVACPPTDLVDMAKKIGVDTISYERIPGSGELHKERDGYSIVCSSDQPRFRQRFTVAHELGHVILERTGRNAPRAGDSVERLCDMLAAECLMPTSVLEARLPAIPILRDVTSMARIFETSITATAIRCAQLRPICVFGVAGDRVSWGHGGIRPGAVAHLLDQVRDGVRAVMARKQPEEHVFFYGNGRRGSLRRFDWIRLGGNTAVFMLTQEGRSAKEEHRPATSPRLRSGTAEDGPADGLTDDVRQE